MRCLPAGIRIIWLRSPATRPATVGTAVSGPAPGVALTLAPGVSVATPGVSVASALGVSAAAPGVSVTALPGVSVAGRAVAGNYDIVVAAVFTCWTPSVQEVRGELIVQQFERCHKLAQIKAERLISSVTFKLTAKEFRCC